MARSWTDVANIALMEIGEDPITSLSNTGTVESLCNTFLPFAREEVLTESNFNFATKRVQLSPRSDVTPPFGYAYYYSKPADWLKGYPISAGSPYYVIESSGLASNESTLAIKYIARITDSNAFSVWAARSVGLNLAITLAARLEKTDASKKQLAAQYQMAIFKARRDDSRERPHRMLIPSTWHDARYRSSPYARIRQTEV